MLPGTEHGNVSVQTCAACTELPRSGTSRQSRGDRCDTLPQFCAPGGASFVRLTKALGVVAASSANVLRTVAAAAVSLGDPEGRS